jgi:hypothetical protein
MSATPASMLQVVSSGLQDRERLNSPQGQPSLQFYKSVMRRRTRWASQWRRVEFDNLADFGRTAIVTLPINGELITRATLVVELPDIYTPQINAINQQIEDPSDNRVIGPYWAWTNSIGHAIIADVDFMIDGQVIDSFNSQLLEVLDEQTTPVEHFDSTDSLIARDPSNFSDQQQIQTYNPFIIVQPQTNPQTLEIVIPFWWNRGPGPQALPIQALSKDKVQIRVTFRPVQQCVYTSTRINALNPPLSSNQGTGPLPNIAGCGFFVKDASSSTLIYDAGSTDNLVEQAVTNPFKGRVLPGVTMPTEYHFTDAHWIVEYVSLEDREATAFRLADLEIPIEQHIPLPLVITGGSPRIRIRMDQGGLVRDLTWVAQRVEAPSYNAHFLFSKDLAPTGFDAPTNPCDVPWWPNALIPNWNYGDGYVRPAFSGRGSDPIVAAKMMIRGLTRFEHEGPSLFRSLIPALNCRRTPLIDRYIYRYDFGFWPTGGLAEANELAVDQIRGYANWDKLPKRELVLTMNQSSCGGFTWSVDTTQEPRTVTGQSFADIDALFTSTTDGLLVTIQGAHPSNPDGTPDTGDNNGDGAIIEGTIDWTQLRRQGGYINLYGRLNHNGSAALVVQKTSGYEWIAVAGGGGIGTLLAGSGGDAASAVEISWQGGNQNQTHEIVSSNDAGAVIYSNLSPNSNVILTGNDISNGTTGFQIRTNGTFVSVLLEFSINTNTEEDEGASIEITFHNVTRGDVYYLTSPQSTVFVPITPYTAFYDATNPLNGGRPTPTVNTSDIVYVEIKTVLNNPLPPRPAPVFTAMGEEGTSNLACELVVNQFPGQAVIPRTFYGGGGGGRLNQAGVGLDDGGQMTTDHVFVTSHQQTGGRTYNFFGGDGYYGGGSGSLCGGGGGSYVSSMIGEINSYTSTDLSDATITLVPLTRVPAVQPSYNLYGWITRYNRLRINSGRGGLMFNEAT